MQANNTASQNALEELIASGPSILQGLDDTVIEDFYRTHDYKPLWLDGNGLHDRARDLLHAIRHAGDEGLRRADYLLEDIGRYRQQYSETKAPHTQAYLDLLLSLAFYRYSHHQYAGRFEPADVDADWHINNRRVDAGKLLEQVAQYDSITSLFEVLPPAHAGYRALREQLQRYRSIQQQGGWPDLGPGPVLEAGMRHVQVKTLRQRLRATADLDGVACCDNDHYDAELKAAVRQFQARHGLAADGVVGPGTRTALNITPAEKIRLIRLNMERWRWMPRDLGRSHIVVNMTGYELYMVRNGKRVLDMPVIIGKTYRATPSVSGWVSYMEYNPYWTIPKKLALNDMVPRQQRNPLYLASRSIKLFSGWENAVEVDPQSVDWSAVDTDNFPYWMRQEPGPGNALGSIKFIFSNPYKVYLHGTPEKHLFDRVQRTMSSGCIRVRDPILLASYLLDGGSWQQEEEVMAAVASGVNERVDLPMAMPIYLAYWTAWVDDDGMMNFREDIYNRDTRLRALFDNLSYRLADIAGSVK